MSKIVYTFFILKTFLYTPLKHATINNNGSCYCAAARFCAGIFRQTHIQKLPDLLLLDIQKFTGGVYVYNYAKY